MHRDRKNDNQPKCRGKSPDNFQNRNLADESCDNSNEINISLDGELHDVQKVKTGKAAEQLIRVQNMLKGMSEYANKNSDSD